MLTSMRLARMSGLSLFSVLLGASLADAAPEIPEEVSACIEKRSLWLAAPDFFERVRVPQPNGRPRDAFQILDRLEGAEGRLLVYPDTCEVVVLVLSPPEPPFIHRFRISSPATRRAYSEEVAALLRWSKLRLLDAGADLGLAERMLFPLGFEPAEPSGSKVWWARADADPQPRKGALGPQASAFSPEPGVAPDASPSRIASRRKRCSSTSGVWKLARA